MDKQRIAWSGAADGAAAEAAAPATRALPMPSGRVLILVAIGLTVGLVGVIGWAQILALRATAQAGAKVERAQALRLVIERIRAATHAARADATAYLLTDADVYLRRMQEAQRDALNQAGVLEQLSADDTAQLVRVQHMRRAVELLFDGLSGAVRNTARPARADDAQRVAGPGPLQVSFDDLSWRLSELDDGQRRRVDALKAGEHERATAGAAAIVVTNLSVLVLLGGLTCYAGVGRFRHRLAASERRYRAMFERSPLAMWVYDAASLRFLDVNRAALERYGYTREEFLRMGLHDIRPLEDIAAVERSVHLNDAQRHGREWRHRTRAGRLLDVAVFSTDIDFDGRPARLVLAEDITARKAAERERNALRERLDQVMQGISEGFVILDGDLRFVYANRQACELLRYPVEELIGRRLPALLQEAQDGPLLPALERARRDGRPVQVEAFDARTQCWFDHHLYPNADGVAVFFADVTERKKSQSLLQDRDLRLARLSQRLLRAYEEERRSIARELHDHFGQELIALKINLESARTGDASIDARLDDSAAIVELLIQQVRDRSLDLHPPVLDDLGLIAAVEWLCGRQSSRSGVAIEVTAPTPLPRLAVEVETACFRIVQEAISNALKHASARRIEVSFVADEGMLHVEVADDGRGFVIDELARGGTNGRNGRHTLGLISMQERAQLLGGKLQILSAPQQGTRVVAEIPLLMRTMDTGSADGGSQGRVQGAEDE